MSERNTHAMDAAIQAQIHANATPEQRREDQRKSDFNIRLFPILTRRDTARASFKTSLVGLHALQESNIAKRGIFPSLGMVVDELKTKITLDKMTEWQERFDSGAIKFGGVAVRGIIARPEYFAWEGESAELSHGVLNVMTDEGIIGRRYEVIPYTVPEGQSYKAVREEYARTDGIFKRHRQLSRMSKRLVEGADYYERAVRTNAGVAQLAGEVMLAAFENFVPLDDVKPSIRTGLQLDRIANGDYVDFRNLPVEAAQ